MGHRPEAVDGGLVTKPPNELDITPSIGGTGLAGVGGMSLGWNIAMRAVYDVPLPDGAWIPAIGMITFVVVLLSVMHVVRARMGAPASQQSQRRQWVIVSVALCVGMVAGFAFAVISTSR